MQGLQQSLVIIPRQGTQQRWKIKADVAAASVLPDEPLQR